MMTTIAIGNLIGLNYADVRALPQSVFEVLVEELHARHAAQETPA